MLLISNAYTEEISNAYTEDFIHDLSVLKSLIDKYEAMNQEYEVWLSDEPLLKDQIYKCWHLPLGLHWYSDFIIEDKKNILSQDLSNPEAIKKTVGQYVGGQVKIRVKLSRYGYLIHEPEILDRTGISKFDKYYPPWGYRDVVQSAREAINDKLCQPLNLPHETYNIWKDMILLFDINDLLIEKYAGGVVEGKTIKKPEQSQLFIGSYGCTLGNCVNGQGSYKWMNGVKYVGGWKEDLPYGEGTMTQADGTKIHGMWEFGEYMGHTEDYECIQGDCENGQGTYKWLNGDKYVGEFKGGLVNGQGTYTYEGKYQAQMTYVGEFKDGFEHGQGTLTWPDGDKYVGEFKGDLFNGQGTYQQKLWSDVNLKYVNVNKYVGEWKDNLRHGQGTETFFNIPVVSKELEYLGKYIGEWEWDYKHGQGTQTWPDGTKYVGEWYYGQFHGLGEYKCNSSISYHGNFMRRNRNLGIIDCKPGRIIKGIWDRNVLKSVVEINF